MEPPLGLPRGKVSVVSHDPRWGELIGSTAVAGLDAKPILDLMLAMRSLQVPRDVFRKLSDIGYEHRAADPVPDRLFFAKGDEGARTHYLSICEFESAFWTSHIDFRDRLRADNRLAREYAALKHELAERFPDDRSAYTNAKECFIRSVSDAAR
jgi:GrpB-like predicted nucleotidyltransferase (UPF0157 family)